MFEERIISSSLLPIFKPTYHRLYRTARNYSMVDRKRFQSLWRLLHRVEASGIEGDFVELGVAGGGTGLLFAGAAVRSRLDRQVWLYDAFEDLEEYEFRYVDVRRTLIDEQGYDPERIHLTRGFFPEALHSRPARSIALLHIDADGHEPIRDSIELLYPLISDGGWLVFDNYGNPTGCGPAVDEFRAKHAIDAPLERFMKSQAYFQKGP